MKYFIGVLILFSFMGCKDPEPRKPIKAKTGSYYKESVKRNKELLAQEEEFIQNIIAADSSRTYHSTANGSWFYYEKQNQEANYYPKADDIVTISYNVVSFSNDTIYSAKEIGNIAYKVDKQELFPGLRNSVKLLKEKETATFLFPSSMAYGYHGDNKNIGVNVPIKSTITIHKIEKNKTIK